jgi:hypothetical protein
MAGIELQTEGHDMNDDATRPQSSNLTLWLVLAACVLPFVAATALFYLAPPQDRMNYGDLIKPSPMPDLVVAGLDGSPLRLSSLRGKWTMVQVDQGACPAACREKLYKMRHVRLTQGKNMDRVQRLWLISDDAAVDEGVLRDYQGTVMARATAELLKALPSSGSPHQHMWLVDPLGNIMLRYPADADPSRMKTDLSRLLRVSRIE